MNAVLSSFDHRDWSEARQMKGDFKKMGCYCMRPCMNPFMCAWSEWQIDSTKKYKQIEFIALAKIDEQNKTRSPKWQVDDKKGFPIDLIKIYKQSDTGQRVIRLV